MEELFIKSALVTGGAGFIGSHLVEELISKGINVTIIDNLANGKVANIPESPLVNTVIANCNCENKMEELCREADTVFHLAATSSVGAIQRDPLNGLENGEQILLKLLKVINQINEKKHVVFASSAAVYGRAAIPPITENHPPNPSSYYAVGKLACENYLKCFHEASGCPVTVLRFFNVYGPRQNPDSAYSGVISKFAKAFSENKPITVYGDGEQTRDFIFVKDLVKAISNAPNIPNTTFNTVNVGTGIPTSINRLIEIMSIISGNKPIIEYQPSKPEDIISSYTSTKLMSQLLNINSIVPIEFGLGFL